MVKTKYYVWNDKVKVLVTADSPMGAVAEALSFKGFTNQTEIDDSLISWPAFGVDLQGFRHINGTITDENPQIQFVQFPTWQIDKVVALDYFDSANSKYDPFCEFEDKDDN